MWCDIYDITWYSPALRVGEHRLTTQVKKKTDWLWGQQMINQSCPPKQMQALFHTFCGTLKWDSPCWTDKTHPAQKLGLLEGPAPKLGQSGCIYRVCSISLFYALIIHIMRTFFTASVISIHLWSECIGLTYCMLHFSELHCFITQLKWFWSMHHQTNHNFSFFKGNHKAADKHIFYHCNRIKLCMAVTLWFYTDSCVYILPCHDNRGRWQRLSKHSLQCIELMVKL